MRSSHAACSQRQSAKSRSGQVLVEFALVSLILYMLFAATIEFGRLLYVAQGTQQVADILAREIAHCPLPANITLADALNHSTVRTTVFDEEQLVIDISDQPDNESLYSWLDTPGSGITLQPINRLLLPLMVIETRETGERFLTYPGAAIDPPGSEYPGRYVVPVLAQDGSRFAWVPVVEELGDDPFLLTSPQRGLVAIRLNYPFQAAAMSAFVPNPEDQFAPNIQQEIEVPDSDPQIQVPTGPYTGEDKLGQHYASGKLVRPFSRVLTAQALARREIFLP